jgi:DNA-binding MarR family transcriptional regulator/nitroimidazol reductase NimA-like FMN-containing flavoprotein (pyridoxamine 5'-phosphate oxidase superfamily)
MDRGECLQLVREVGWGVLAVAECGPDGAAVPLGVPVAYAFQDEQILLVMTEGRKRAALRRNPRLCLTVTDVGSLAQWRSVAVVGRPRWIADPAERRRAEARYLAAPRRDGWRLAPEDGARVAHAEIAALEIDELHGFTVDANTDADADRRAAADAMDVLRRIVRSLHVTKRDSEARLGVTAAQLFVLREIAKAGTLSIGDLARRAATTQSSVSEVVARLTRRDLIVRARADDDRRRAELALSESGRALLARAPETIQERLLAAFDRLPARTRQTTADGMKAWLAEAGLSELEAPMFFEPVSG